MTLMLVAGFWINTSHIIGMWNLDENCVVNVRGWQDHLIVENKTCEQFLSNARTIKVE